jgi:hypothetical protein
MHHWYQIDLQEALHFESKGLILPGKGFRYKNEEGLDMVEIHVEGIPDNALHTKINYECCFGRNLSVQKGQEERPLLSFCQYECIFCHFIFTRSAWTGPKGEQGIVPKNEGKGPSPSAFQSRNFGFRMT